MVLPTLLGSKATAPEALWVQTHCPVLIVLVLTSATHGPKRPLQFQIHVRSHCSSANGSCSSAPSALQLDCAQGLANQRSH